MRAKFPGDVTEGVKRQRPRGEVNTMVRPEQGGFVLHGFLNPPNEITAGLDILPAL